MLAHATFASPRVSGTSSLPNKCSIDYRASVSLQPRLHRIYRVAVEFTSRRISKGSRSAFHSFQALLYSRGDYALHRDGLCVNPQKLRFRLSRVPDNRYLPIPGEKHCSPECIDGARILSMKLNTPNRSRETFGNAIIKKKPYIFISMYLFDIY